MRVLLATLAAALLLHAAPRNRKQPEASPLDRYIQEATSRGGPPPGATPGSTWSPSSRFADVASDLRAGQVDDLITIVVAEQASAVAKGSLKSTRQSTQSTSIPALGGLTKAKGPLANLAGISGDNKLTGEGTTSRTTQLDTTLSARVTHVLPNGYLVVEGSKDVQVNSERQQVTVRGVIRPADLTATNQIRSDRLAQMEVRINGKGVVADAVRRPMFLYRLLLGLLPF